MNARIRSAITVLMLLVPVLLASPTNRAAAQIPPSMMGPSVDGEGGEASPPPSQADLHELSRLLRDPAIIEWLENRAGDPAIDAAGPAQAGGAAGNDGMALVQQRVDRVKTALHSLPLMPGMISGALEKEFPGQDKLRVWILVLIFFFIGAGLEWLYWCYAGPLKTRIESHRNAAFVPTILAAIGRFAVTAGGAFAFGLGTLGSFLGFDWPPQFKAALIDILWAIVLVRALTALLEFVLAPRVDSLRLVPLVRRDAKWLYVSTLVIAFAVLVGVSLSNTVTRVGAPPEAGLGLKIVIAACAALMAIDTIWVLFLRHAEKHVPFKGACPRRKGILLPIGGTILIIAIYVLWLVGAFKLSASLAVIGITIPVAIGVRRTVLRAFDPHPVAELPPPPAGEGEAETAAGDEDDADGETDAHDDAHTSGRVATETGSSIYRPIVERLARFFVLGSAAAVLAVVWGLDLDQLSQASSLPGRFFGVAIDIAIAFLIADLVWIITRTAIDRKMASMPKPEHGVAPGPEARLATLLPVFRLAVLITIVVMLTMITLSSLGVDIGPLLAGAGVIGLALGFGAQALVRDIVSGIFFLIDDAFRVGEYIEMGELRGTVESISLRSLRVRHHRGAVHTIPFGELKSLTNYSRDWVMMKLEFRVPFDTDLKLAKKLVKQIDAELRSNPDYGHSFLEPLKFQGVRRMEEFNMVVGVKFMTRPGEQWTIRRDAYQRIRDEFEKHGINFAQRNVKVEVIGNQPLTEDIKNAAVGAAQDAIEQQVGGKAQA
ncbi:MAG: mechanosensitive ion channel family protein [Geminicoccaceae bacterium]|nr:mechanosensitive ion channel family protein [Geminicoccaceae bacterium]